MCIWSQASCHIGRQLAGAQLITSLATELTGQHEHCLIVLLVLPLALCCCWYSPWGLWGRCWLWLRWLETWGFPHYQLK